MFEIGYFIDKSQIHKLGIFANQDIKEGETIYVHNEELDLIISEEKFQQLPEKEKKLIKHYGYFDKKLKKWRLDHDDIRFCNHSKNPNITLKKGKIVAKKDISKGKELLQDYSEFREAR